MLFGKRLKKPDPEAEKKLREQIRAEGGVDKKDTVAMILSAYLTILPVVLVVLGIMVLFIWLLFM